MTKRLEPQSDRPMNGRAREFVSYPTRTFTSDEGVEMSQLQG